MTTRLHLDADLLASWQNRAEEAEVQRDALLAEIEAGRASDDLAAQVATLDAIVHALGIEDSHADSLEVIRALQQDASERDHFMRLAFVDLGTNKETWKERAEKAEAEIESGRADAGRVRDTQRAAVEAAYREGFSDGKRFDDADAAWLLSALNGADYDPGSAQSAAQPAAEPYDDLSEEDFQKLLEILPQDRPTRRRIISSIAPLLRQAIRDASPAGDGAEG